MPIACPVCESDRWSVDAVATRILALPPTHSIVVCEACGQRRLDPQLSDAELDALYSGAYFGSAQAASVPAVLSAAPPAANYSHEVVAARYGKFEKTLARLKQLHPDARTLLDVGAATGDLVKIARGLGFEAHGIEMSQYAVARAQEVNGVVLERRKLTEVSRTSYYDCVHLNHVFEHFNDPLAELSHIRRLLRDHGLLYMEVPYQFQFVEKLLFRFRNSEPVLTLNSLHHAYFYTPQTLSRLLSANGFEVLSVSVFDPDRYQAADLGGRLKKAVWSALSSMSIGNHIELYARRSA